MTHRIAESIDRLHLEAVASDGQAGGELTGRYDVRFWLGAGVQSEDQAARGLAETARSLLRQRTVALARAKAATGALDAQGHRSAQVARFHEAFAALRTDVTSYDGLVRVQALGVEQIVFHVEPGALQAGHAAVADAATEAVRRAVAELVVGIRRVRREADAG